MDKKKLNNWRKNVLHRLHGFEIDIELHYRWRNIESKIHLSESRVNIVKSTCFIIVPVWKSSISFSNKKFRAKSVTYISWSLWRPEKTPRKMRMSRNLTKGQLLIFHPPRIPRHCHKSFKRKLESSIYRKFFWQDK